MSMLSKSSMRSYGHAKMALKINPPDLLTMDGTEKSFSEGYIQMFNPTGDFMAFRVKGTTPKNFAIKPNVGVLSPNEKVELFIRYRPRDRRADKTHGTPIRLLIVAKRVDSKQVSKQVLNDFPENCMGQKMSVEFNGNRTGHKQWGSEDNIDYIHGAEKEEHVIVETPDDFWWIPYALATLFFLLLAGSISLYIFWPKPKPPPEPEFEEEEWTETTEGETTFNFATTGLPVLALLVIIAIAAYYFTQDSEEGGEER